MHPFKVIFFDFDGVIVESNKLKADAFFEVFDDYKDKIELIKSYEKENAPLSRFQKFRDLRKILQIEDENIEKIWADSYSSLTLKKVINCGYVNGALNFLELAKKNYPLYLLSNTPQVDLEKIVDARKLKDYFEGILGSPIIKSEALLDHQKKNSLSGKDILFVGDNLTDMKAAHDSGTQFVGRFSGVKFPETELVVQDLNELKNLIFT